MPGAWGGREEAAETKVASLNALTEAIMACRRCPLFEKATRAVMGSGPANARVMLVGEQPEDAKDLSGKVFAGPVGKALDEVLGQIGLKRQEFYITNAIKHFKFAPQGKRRLHRNPDGTEIEACKAWLDHEIRLVDPQVIVAVGANAARSLLGMNRSLAQLRSKAWLREDGKVVFVTYHPSCVLHVSDAVAEQKTTDALVADLAAVAHFLQSVPGARATLDTASCAP